MWVIVKKMENEKGILLPVIILNENYEIWEFDSEIDAEKMRQIFQKNSDSGHQYELRKI